MTSILITEGAGFVGCHTARELARQGFYPLSFDNLSEGYRKAVVAGDLIVGDLSNEVLLDSVFEEYKVYAVRDYIYVEDLASAHVSALRWLKEGKKSKAFNLGTGNGRSVKQVLQMVKKGYWKECVSRTVSSPRWGSFRTSCGSTKSQSIFEMETTSFRSAKYN